VREKPGTGRSLPPNLFFPTLELLSQNFKATLQVQGLTLRILQYGELLENLIIILFFIGSYLPRETIGKSLLKWFPPYRIRSQPK
jgi:hypothetical protein